MAISNPITAQGIVDRFAAYVVATANAGIVYHSGNLPFPEYRQDNPFGTPIITRLGSSAGLTIQIDGSDITPDDNIITAANIYSELLAETNRYTKIRNGKFNLIIGTGSGNRTRPASDAKTLTGKAHFADDRQEEAIDTPSNIPVANTVINDTSLEAFFTSLRDNYSATSTKTVNRTVCHSSCHSSCHGSRGRR